VTVAQLSVQALILVLPALPEPTVSLEEVKMETRLRPRDMWSMNKTWKRPAEEGETTVSSFWRQAAQNWLEACLI